MLFRAPCDIEQNHAGIKVVRRRAKPSFVKRRRRVDGIQMRSSGKRVAMQVDFKKDRQAD